MEQRTAPIAHEVNQPIAASLLNAGNAVRWLACQLPNLETKQSSDRIISDGKRAAEIVKRIRDFSKKTPLRKGDLAINEAILEIMRLAHAAMSEHGVLVTMQFVRGTAAHFGDRIQLQQVFLN
jgi:C4-dicarboxylate-specific signal transduction histidine kinase